MHPLREYFDYPSLEEKKFPLIGENYKFDPRNFKTLASFEILYNSSAFSTAFQTFSQEYFLRSFNDPNKIVRIGLSLHWQGYLSALEALFSYAESFERAIPVRSTENTADTYDFGHFGLAWNWENDPRPTHLAFHHCNLLVIIESGPMNEENILIARELDQQLENLSTCRRYTDSKKGFLRAFKKAANFRSFSIDHRIDLGIQPAGEHFHFLSTSGSVNRDLDTPEMWFLQTGEAGQHTLTLFRTDDGILPVREQVEFSVEERDDDYVIAAE